MMISAKLFDILMIFFLMGKNHHSLVPSKKAPNERKPILTEALHAWKHDCVSYHLIFHIWDLCNYKLNNFSLFESAEWDNFQSHCVIFPCLLDAHAEMPPWLPRIKTLGVNFCQNCMCQIPVTTARFLLASGSGEFPCLSLGRAYEQN